MLLPVSVRRSIMPSLAQRLIRTVALEESPAAQEHLVDSQQRAAQPLSARERRAELIVGGAFVLVASVLAAFAPGEAHLSLGWSVALVLAFAVASRVEFDVGSGYTAPSQLVFVMMLFALPPGAAPLCAAVGLALARAGERVLSGKPPGRALLSLSDSWFAVGPAIVLVLAGSPSAAEAQAGILVAALAAQFAGDFWAAAVREVLNHGADLREQAVEASWVYLVDALLTPVGFAGALAAATHAWAVLLVIPLVALLQLFALERRARVESTLELSRAYRGTAVLLGDMVDADHAYTGRHSRGVVQLSLAVADRLSLSSAQRRRTELGALLHDIGKIAVPKELIDKPGPLDDDEWLVMKRHTIAGQEMLEKVGGVLADVGAVVRSSHEHVGGGGYPDGLVGEAIPIESRIVSCCDAYSAMTTSRSYRGAMSQESAAEELRRCAGTQFDPAVVAALLELLEGEPAPGEGPGQVVMPVN